MINDWTMRNFSQDYSYRFIQAFTGNVLPIRAELLVDLPVQFRKVWATMKPMISKICAKKVHKIDEDLLEDFLTDGYEQYLADEFICWQAQTEEICEVSYPKRIRGQKQNETGQYDRQKMVLARIK